MTTTAADVRRAPTIGYRPGLDGVRAFAVVFVMLYHDDVSWAKGGFLGVDVFFVLSGYLITSLLVTELRDTGSLRFVAFWTRRARRLLPALFLMLVGVAVYAAIWAHPTELQHIRSDGIATLLYVSNWKFIFDGTSYFQAFQIPSPLQHTWSLAIEEQWYLIWPPVLLLLFRWTRRSTVLLASVIAALAAASAVLMAVRFHPGTDPSRLYYGTDTRAQALLLGAVLAVLSVRTPGRARSLGPRLTKWATQFAGLVGAVGLAVAVSHANATGAFLYRGGFALVALAALGVIAAAAVEGPISSALGIRPLRAIGAISYGLYLWHWPVDVLFNEARTGHHGLALIAIRTVVTFAIATASYFAVERPIRHHGLRAIRIWPRSVPRFVILPAAAVVLVGALLVTTRGAQSFAIPTPPAAASDNGVDDHVQPLADHTRVLMLGDSQMYTMAFWDSGRFTRSGPQYDFAPLVGCGVFDAGAGGGSHCELREATWQARLRRFDPDLSVVLIGAWESLDFTADGHHYVHGTPEHAQALEAIIARRVRTLSSRGGRVALLEVPCFGLSPDGGADAQVRADPNAVANVNQALRAVAARNPKQATFVPWGHDLCPGGRYVAKVDGRVVRPDGVHFGNTPDADVAARELAPILRRFADASHRARQERS